MSPRPRAYLELIIVAAIWGVAGPVIKYTLGYFDTVVFLTLRFFITCLVMIPLLFILHPRTWHTLGTLSGRDWLLLIAAGIMGSTVQLGLLFWGFNLTTSIDGTLINNTAGPILTVLAGHILLKDRLTRKMQLGITLAAAGSIAVIIEPILATGRIFSGSFIGNLLVLLASVAWAAYALLSKVGTRKHLSPLLQTASMFFFGFISMSVICILLAPLSTIRYTLYAAPASAYAGVLYMALISGALAYFLYEKGQQTVSASEANIFLYLPTVFTAPVSYFWLHEPITPAFITGALLIIAGVYISETRSK